MVLITSAQFCSADFTLEFGLTVPSFLPIGGKRLYALQATLFKGEELVLALPKSFKISPYDASAFSKLGIRPLFVPDGLKLGEMVVYCVNILGADEELSILHGDTYFQSFEKEPDAILVSKVRENYNWSYLDEGFCLRNVDFKKEGKILAGGFCFSRPRTLIKHIVSNDYSFIAGVRDYSKEFALFAVENETWLDFGLMTNYLCAKQSITTQRAFNSLHFEKGFFIKSSKNENKIKAEAAWFENIPQDLLLFVPRFLSCDEGYKNEYLFQNTLAELFVFGNLPPFVWRRIFLSLKEFLQSLSHYKSEEALDFDYKGKTLARLKELPTSFLKTKFKLKNEELDALTLIEKLDCHLKSPLDFSFIHGDLCFSNIMFDFRAGRVMVYDPRGMDFSGKITAFGDKNYDLAKLVHSVFGLYDFILADFFDFDPLGNIIFQNNTSDIGEVFLEFFELDDNIKAISIHLFLSMLPLHSDDAKRQKAIFANAFRLYELFFGDRACG